MLNESPRSADREMHDHAIVLVDQMRDLINQPMNAGRRATIRQNAVAVMAIVNQLPDEEACRRSMQRDRRLGSAGFAVSHSPAPTLISASAHQ
jgi:hypothetical protein